MNLVILVIVVILVNLVILINLMDLTNLLMILVFLVNLEILVILLNLGIHKIFCLWGLKGHIVDGGRTTKCEDKARILDSEFAITGPLSSDIYIYQSLHRG